MFVSGSQSINSPQTNAIALLKRSAEFRILVEIIQSTLLQLKNIQQVVDFMIKKDLPWSFLTEYAGNYGIRFDDCGWGIIFHEHIHLTSFLKHWELFLSSNMGY